MSDSPQPMDSTQQRGVGPVTSAERLPERYEQRFSSTDGVADDTARAVVRELVDRPPSAATLSQLADAVGCSRQTICRAVDGLQADGIVCVHQPARTKLVYLNHPASDWAVPDDIDLVDDTTFETVAESDLDVLLGRPLLTWRNLVVAGSYLAIMQAVAAVVFSVALPALTDVTITTAIGTLITALALGAGYLVRAVAAKQQTG